MRKYLCKSKYLQTWVITSGVLILVLDKCHTSISTFRTDFVR